MSRRFFILSVTLGALAVASLSFASDVSVTVYNSNLGVVHETRSLEFDQGIGRVSFADVPSRIDPTSVGFDLIDRSGSVTILEQNYAYDLVSPEKIYSKYIDNRIDIFDKEGNAFSGRLLSFAGGSFVIQNDNGRIRIVRTEQVTNADFPELPEGLITRPTLFWLYSSTFAGRADCEVSYQTGGLSWSAEYVGILSEDEKRLHLTGWSSIQNNSGATYKDASLKLVAGDIHRAAPPSGRGRFEMADLSMAKAPSAAFEEKEFFEYHLYTLPRKATLADNEIKQIALFDPATTEVTKEYYYEPDKNRQDVRVAIRFENADDKGLGLPLPKGRARVFKADTDGSMILLGEDRIDHTPRNEEIKMTVGYAFDLAAEYQVIDFTKISSRVEENTHEIKLRNHKEEDVIVIVEKIIGGDWEIIETTHEFEKKKANTIEFRLPVRADGETTLVFKVRTKR